jgi:hypothetical protein
MTERNTVRLSQIVTTFGPGSMIDLPKTSIMISGLNHWNNGDGGARIMEPRLAAKVAEVLNRGNVELRSPPIYDEEDHYPTLIRAYRFPNWFVAQGDADGRHSSSKRRLIHSRLPNIRGAKWTDENRNEHTIVPVRFVRACYAGHVDDIDWVSFIHHGASTLCTGPLYLEERGSSGDLSSMIVSCGACESRRPLSDARSPRAEGDEAGPLGRCTGARHWLGPGQHQHCDQPANLLIRTASNAYFPHVLSVISIPEIKNVLEDLISRHWQRHLKDLSDENDLKNCLRFNDAIKDAFSGQDPKKIWEVIVRMRNSGVQELRPIKELEIEQFLNAPEAFETDTPHGDYFARSLPHRFWTSQNIHQVSKVILIHRLREVVANIGFTRMEPSNIDINGELDTDVRRGAIAPDNINWVPAYENRGEGIFIEIDRGKIDEWSRRSDVIARGIELRQGIEHWNQNNRREIEDLGLPYRMLHSLAHILITELSLTCGYPASSLKERIYATSVGYGILIYTGTSDAEGTLGGLIEAGKNIRGILERGLRNARLCSNDPICAQHDLRNPHDTRHLVGAACHACLLIAETCCERHNTFLDRALVVPTVHGGSCAFFGDV